MHAILIRDGTEPGARGGLEFDLAEVLAALGDRVATSRWRGRGLFYVSRDEQDIESLERLGVGEDISGVDLLAALPRLLQVIDGEFEATSAAGEVPWVIVRAVDSSWWEIRSEEPRILEALRASFRVVENLPPVA
jgi:hypothetical protein